MGGVPEGGGGGVEAGGVAGLGERRWIEEGRGGGLTRILSGGRAGWVVDALEMWTLEGICDFVLSSWEFVIHTWIPISRAFSASSSAIFIQCL